MSEPTQLRPPVTPQLTVMLTEILRRAQAGEIAQVALVALGMDGDTYSTMISDRSADAPNDHATLKLIGAVTDLQFELLNLHNQRQ